MNQQIYCTPDIRIIANQIILQILSRYNDASIHLEIKWNLLFHILSAQNKWIELQKLVEIIQQENIHRTCSRKSSCQPLHKLQPQLLSESIPGTTSRSTMWFEMFWLFLSFCSSGYAVVSILCPWWWRWRSWRLHVFIPCYEKEMEKDLSNCNFDLMAYKRVWPMAFWATTNQPS